MKKHYTPPKNWKQLAFTLGAMALGALFGYVETLIPALFGSLSFAKVQLALVFVLFVTICYSPAEGSIAWGVRCLTYGLCMHNGFGMLVELLSGVAALCAVYYLVKCGTIGLVYCAPFYAVCYSFVYCCVYSCVLGNGYLFYQWMPFASFLTVNALVIFALVYLGVKFVPAKWLYVQEQV